MERTELERKEYEESLQAFRGQCETILKSLKEEGKEVVKWEIMEEKTFIIFNHVLLVLCGGRELLMVTADETERRRPILLKKDGVGFKLLAESGILLCDESRDIELRTANVEEWAAALSQPE